AGHAGGRGRRARHELQGAAVRIRQYRLLGLAGGDGRVRRRRRGGRPPQEVDVGAAEAATSVVVVSTGEVHRRALPAQLPVRRLLALAPRRRQVARLLGDRALRVGVHGGIGVPVFHAATGGQQGDGDDGQGDAHGGSPVG